MIGLSPYQKWGCSTPNSQNLWHNGYSKRVKVENFLYILHFSGPRRVHRHQCYTTYWGRSWCKKTIVPYLPIRPYISQGAKSAAPTRVNLGPPHISETIRARKSKLYTHLDRTKYSSGMTNFQLGGARGRAGGIPGGLKLQCRAIATFSSFIYFKLVIASYPARDRNQLWYFCFIDYRSSTGKFDDYRSLRYESDAA